MTNVTWMSFKKKRALIFLIVPKMQILSSIWMKTIPSRKKRNKKWFKNFNFRTKRDKISDKSKNRWKKLIVYSKKSKRLKTLLIHCKKSQKWWKIRSIVWMIPYKNPRNRILRSIRLRYRKIRFNTKLANVLTKIDWKWQSTVFLRDLRNKKSAPMSKILLNREKMST